LNPAAAPKRRRTRPLVTGVLLGLLAAAGWLLRRPAPAPPVVPHPTAVQMAQTRQHLASLGRAASRTQAGPRLLRLSENDLNVTLAANPSVRGLLTKRGVQAVQIVLQEPDAVVVHASVRVQGHFQNVQISGTLSPDPKTGLRFSAFAAQAGRLPLPPALINAQANQLAARFSRPLLRRLSLTVQSVSIQKKDLLLTCAPASPPGASPAPH
jgi:hypothetical protein